MGRPLGQKSGRYREEAVVERWPLVAFGVRSVTT